MTEFGVLSVTRYRRFRCQEKHDLQVSSFFPPFFFSFFY